ncbi:MAG: ftsI [Ilumatobacteraceae bacterium]|nr:ftsI [Ilumatobacteraceae bacterium]
MPTRRSGRAAARAAAEATPQKRPLQRRKITPRVIRHRFKGGNSRTRMRWMFAVSALLFVAVLAKVVLLQTAQAAGLVKAGKDQRTSETVLKAGRGTIFDRDGVELALSVPKMTITANPKLVTDPTGTATLLAQLLDLTPDKQQALQTSFAAKDKSFVYVVRQIDDNLAASVMALKLPGIAANEEDQRVLPGGDVGLDVVGRTDIDGLGTAGLEKQYDDVLTGTDGQRTMEHDSKGRSIPGSDATTTQPIPGEDLELTIDRSLQYQVEQALLQGINQADVMAKGATAVVMDTQTGEVLAMVSVDRDASGTARVTSANNALVQSHEPGSVAKIFSVSGALNEGVATPDTTVNVPGFIVFDKGTKWQHQINDAESHAIGPMSLRRIIEVSSNIGTYTVTSQIGLDKITAYLHAFGFGESTPLGFPGESAGSVRAAADLQGTEKATITYGYGYSASSMQLAAAANTIANGGVYVAPKLVKATVDATGTLAPTPASATHTVVSPGAAASMTSMMVDVVCNKDGTAHGTADIPGMTVAGKTGTAYKVWPGGGYVGPNNERAYFASFVGFFPASAPKVTILVSVDEPDPTSNARFGGTGAAPIFATIGRAVISEEQITPPPGDTGCSPAAG